MTDVYISKSKTSYSNNRIISELNMHKLLKVDFDKGYLNVRRSVE